MAVVSDKHKFIFFHLYKCGGTSVRELLKNIDGTQDLIGGHTLPRDVKYHYEMRGKKYIDIFEIIIEEDREIRYNTMFDSLKIDKKGELKINKEVVSENTILHLKHFS